jgi:antitoxin YefM
VNRGEVWTVADGVSRLGVLNRVCWAEGVPFAVLAGDGITLLAVDDLESLEETIAVLSDAPALRALGEADAELARGEGENQDNLAAARQARRTET